MTPSVRRSAARKGHPLDTQHAQTEPVLLHRGVSLRQQPGVRTALVVLAAGAILFGTVHALRLVPDQFVWLLGTVASTVGALVSFWCLRKLTGTCSVTDALSAYQRGERDASMLVIDSSAGQFAGAWNQIAQGLSNVDQADALDKENLEDQRRAGGSMESACDAMWQGVILVNRNHEVEYANAAAAVYLGSELAELQGSDLCEIVGDETVAESIREVAEGDVRRRKIVEIDQAAATGLRRVLRFGIRPVRQEDEGIAIVMIEDITQQRIAEESRQSFVAQATHELRTPLTNIRLYLESAMDDQISNEAEKAHALSVINAESLRLERIVSDMLSVSEMESGSIGLARDDVRLDALFTDLKDSNAPTAEAKKQTLSFDLPPKLPVLQGDRDKLASSIQNLIGNAIKYTPEGGRIEVLVSTDDGEFRVDITDNGLGISEDEQAKVFETFFRSSNEKLHGIEGSGLGLGLARQIARLHGGDISIESELGVGSTFSFIMPLASAESERRAA